MEIISVRGNPEYLEQATDYYAEKWGIDREIYYSSVSDCISTNQWVPRWYLMIEDGRIIGGYGLIENDFIVRKDLTPWLCALYIEKDKRGNSLGNLLLEHGRREAGKLGFNTLYLCSDHIGYYEKYGWKYFGDEESEFGGLTRVYTVETKF